MTDTDVSRVAPVAGAPIPAVPATVTVTLYGPDAVALRRLVTRLLDDSRECEAPLDEQAALVVLAIGLKRALEHPGPCPRRRYDDWTA